MIRYNDEMVPPTRGREDDRGKTQRKRFFIVLIGALLLSGLVQYLAYRYLGEQVRIQDKIVTSLSRQHSAALDRIQSLSEKAGRNGAEEEPGQTPAGSKPRMGE